MTAAPQPGADARRAAACAMMRQEQNGYANLVLAKELDRFCGAAKDRALAAAIFYGTVERMATIDWILGRFLARPLRAADAVLIPLSLIPLAFTVMFAAALTLCAAGCIFGAAVSFCALLG